MDAQRMRYRLQLEVGAGLRYSPPTVSAVNTRFGTSFPDTRAGKLDAIAHIERVHAVA